MISDFKQQTPETIFRFLSQLGQVPEVFSKRYEDICLALEDKCTYVYCTENELVLVMIDVVLMGTKERASLHFADPNHETHFQNVTTALMRHSRTRRTSPLWQLYCGATSLRDVVCTKGRNVKVHAVLITTSQIQNYSDLLKSVKKVTMPTVAHPSPITLTVLHGCQSFYDQWSILKLPLNMDFFLTGSILMREYEDYMEAQRKEQARKEEENNYFDSKEFSELMQHFIDEAAIPDSSDDSDDPGTSIESTPPTLESRIAACQSPEERRRLIILRAKLAI